MPRYETFDTFCIGTYGKVPNVIGCGPELQAWKEYRGDVNLRDLECKLQVIDTVETEGDKVVYYVVPDNHAGITAVRLVTLYEADDKDDCVNPTWLEVQSTDINVKVIAYVSEMTGWSLAHTNDEQYHDGWHMLTPINVNQHIG